jgi:uncharacterized RDD family membrane protein YckC
MRDPHRYDIPEPTPGQPWIRGVSTAAAPPQTAYVHRTPGAAWPLPAPKPVRYASWSQRVCASLIDAFASIVVMLAALLIGSLLNVGIISVLLLLAAVGFGLWNQYYLQAVTGQTIGKARIGIYLRRESDGEFLGIGMNVVRSLAHLFDQALFGLGYLWPIWDPKSQTFADKLCQTIVTCN